MCLPGRGGLQIRLDGSNCFRTPAPLRDTEGDGAAFSFSLSLVLVLV